MEKIRVVIVGGGFGGLESAFYVRQRLGDRADVTLVSDRDYLLFRPYMTYVPFGLVPEAVQIDLAKPMQEAGVHFIQGKVGAFVPEEKAIHVGDRVLPYDYLVLATGAALGPEDANGLHEHAFTAWKMADMTQLRSVFQQLTDEVLAGHRRRVVLLVPPGCQWAGPLYELAFMLETWLQWKDVREGIDIVFVTSERSFMEVFGPRLHDVIREEFNRRHIMSYVEQPIQSVVAGALIDHEDHRWPFDVLVAAPSYVPSTVWHPLPTDERGFLITEPATRQVVNHPDIYAVGDGANYPIKQAFLALLQADAAAEHLSARVLRTEPTFAFSQHSLWLMEQLDQALLVQPPSDAQAGATAGQKPEDRTYQVERLAVGQLRRMVLRAYLPHHFDATNALYAGLLWKGTKVGLSVLSHLVQH
ncbi:MAG: NAD(P)/FAD-dependent oxidoreductase [Rhodothermales bacterium]